MTGEMVALANPWEQIKARLTTRISARAYEDWVTRTVFDGSEGCVLRVTVPDQVTKTWMEQEYAEDIRDAIRELNLPVERVVYATPPSGVSTGITTNVTGTPGAYLRNLCSHLPPASSIANFVSIITWSVPVISLRMQRRGR